MTKSLALMSYGSRLPQQCHVAQGQTRRVGQCWVPRHNRSLDFNEYFGKSWGCQQQERFPLLRDFLLIAVLYDEFCIGIKKKNFLVEKIKFENHWTELMHLSVQQSWSRRQTHIVWLKTRPQQSWGVFSFPIPKCLFLMPKYYLVSSLLIGPF